MNKPTFKYLQKEAYNLVNYVTGAIEKGWIPNEKEAVTQVIQEYIYDGIDPGDDEALSRADQIDAEALAFVLM